MRHIFGKNQLSKLIEEIFIKQTKYIFIFIFTDRNTFNHKLCRELGLEPNEKSVNQIIKVVTKWNVHKILKRTYCNKTHETQRRFTTI